MKKGWANGSPAPPHPESSRSYTGRELHKCPRGDPHPRSVPCMTTSIPVPTTHGVQIWCPQEGAAELEQAHIQHAINQRGCMAKGVPTAGKSQGKIREGPLFGLARGSADAPSWYHGGWRQCSRNAATPRSCQLAPRLLPSPTPSLLPLLLCLSSCSSLCSSLHFPLPRLHLTAAWGRDQPEQLPAAAPLLDTLGMLPAPKGPGSPGLPTLPVPLGSLRGTPAQGCSQPPVTGAQRSAGMAAA